MEGEEIESSILNRRNRFQIRQIIGLVVNGSHTQHTGTVMKTAVFFEKWFYFNHLSFADVTKCKEMLCFSGKGNERLILLAWFIR